MPNTSPRRRAAARAAALAGAAALGAAAACGTGGPQDITGAAPAARLKFFNFGVGAPNVNFFAGDSLITAVSNTACTPLPSDTTALGRACRANGVPTGLGVGSGAAAAGGFYTGITPGQYALSARLSDTTAANRNVVVASFPLQVAAGKSYSVYLSGVYNTTARTVDGFVLEDPNPATPAADTVYVRFVNASPTAGPLRLFIGNSATGELNPLSPAVAYKAGGPVVRFRVAPPFLGVNSDLVVRSETGTANLVVRTAVGLSTGRLTTVTVRGDITVTSTTAATRPQIDVTAGL